MHEPEFFRTSQKCYLRIECNSGLSSCYEYQMCLHNIINSFLSFQEWNINGQSYLQYDVSGMQSLDIYIQTRKLQKQFALKLMRALQKLCDELSEYALQIECVNFNPKYIMIDSSQENIRFLYTFHSDEAIHISLEKLLECCIENINYKDEELTEEIYGIYENLLNQKEKFFLKNEVEKLIQDMEDYPNAKKEEESITVTEQEGSPSNVLSVSEVMKKEYKGLKRGILIIILLDIGMIVFWKPLTLLKIFWGSAVGIVFSGLYIYVKHQEELKIKEIKRELQEGVFMEEYKQISEHSESDEGATQIISLETTQGILYNLKEEDPKCIHIDEIGKVIGKDEKKAQVYINKKSISRIHAFVIKKEKECFIEDLNSTNGTQVNGTVLVPRTRYLLKQGDTVCFAEQEYIFR